MTALAVDDEKLMLYALVKAIRTSEHISSVKDFLNGEEALEWIKENPVDIAFLDINMRGIGGLCLAERIKELHPDCRIIFCTGYEEYAVAAFRLHASGYLLKPVTAEDVCREIDIIMGVKNKGKLLRVSCFGNFEVYCRDSKLNFKRTKSKEMLAYLIDRQGAGVTAGEISAVLWEDKPASGNRNYFHQLLLDVRMTLDAVGASEVLEKNGYYYSVNTEKIDCDYYSYIKSGQPEFSGEYMSQYRWAEETCGLLWQRSNTQHTD